MIGVKEVTMKKIAALLIFISSACGAQQIASTNANGPAGSVIGYNAAGHNWLYVPVDANGYLLVDCPDCTGGGTTTDALVGNDSGTGAASGSSFNGSEAVTWSYNTLGAAGIAAANSFTAGPQSSVGGFVAIADEVHNGYTSWVGNTADAVVPVNTVGFGGPDTSATGTAYRCNLPWTNPSAGQVLSCGTPNGSGVSQGTWVNPGTSGGLVQVPATTAANTISPTANNVVGLTVNATSGTDSVDVMDVVTAASGSFNFNPNGNLVVPAVSYGIGGLVAGGTAFGVPSGEVNYSGQTFAQAGCSTLSGSSGGCLVWNVGATTVTAPYFTSPYTPAIYMVNGGAATVATATTIAPTTPLVNLTGAIPIATITLPANFTTGCFNAVPVSTVLTTTAGNIAAIYSLLGGKLYTACYMGSAWYFVGSGI